MKKMTNLKSLLFIACLALPLSFARAQTADADNISGKVTETMDTAGYTYVLVDSGTKKVWAAAPQFAVKTGDTVSFAPSMPMPGYHSQSLNRDFDLVYFANGITVNGGGIKAALPPGHPALNQKSASPNLDLSNIKRAEGGKIVQEIISGAAKLAGKEVTVRGKVVKYNADIMGKNWLHIRDGSGSADKKDNDLLVTTDTDAKVGDTVLVTGKIAVNQDFGAGYKYAVMLADAKVTVE
jgi:hypothetical protein